MLGVAETAVEEVEAAGPVLQQKWSRVVLLHLAPPQMLLADPLA
jgi:hypothetical protein